MSFSRTLPKLTVFAAIALVSIAAAGAARAQSATEIQLSYKDKKFDPAEISAPANTPIVIKLKNLDAKAMEFESKTLEGGEGGRRLQRRHHQCPRAEAGPLRVLRRI